MLSQDDLRARFAARLRELGQRAATDGWDAPHASEDASASRLLCVAVQRRFDPLAFARSLLEFTWGLPDPLRDAWLGAYTRTVFLAGNPANLAGRCRFDHVARDGAIAWTGPIAAQAAMGLRRLLVLFDGRLPPDLPGELELAGAERGEKRALREVYVATVGLTVADYLIHLGHLLAEAVLTGTVDPGDRFLIRHVQRLDALSARFISLRVHRDKEDSTRLRAYAGIATAEHSDTA